MSRRKPWAEVWEIGPARARELLESNTHNRTVRRRVVNSFADDMRRGAWEFNGESLKFSSDGTVLDGQHRLHAIATSGVAVSTVVVGGLPARAQETIDVGPKRKFSDVLTLRGESHAVTLAALVRHVRVWTAGVRTFDGSVGNVSCSVPTLLKTLDEHPEVRDYAKMVGSLSRRSGLTKSCMGLLWWVFASLDDDAAASDAEYFFERLADRQGLVDGDPLYALARVLDRSKLAHGERSTTYHIAVTIKAWNAYRDGKPLTRLAFRPGGASPEAFPVPH